MSASLVTMRENVKFKIGRKEGMDSTIDAKINEAVLYVLSVYRPQDMWGRAFATTVSGQAEYTFNIAASDLQTAAPDDVLDLYAILMVRDQTNDREILRGSMRHFNRLRQDTSVASTLGPPRRWTREANQLILYSRIPNATALTVKVTYLRRPPVMVEAAPPDPAVDFPLNEEWQGPVEEYAAFLLWTDLNEANKAAAKLSAFQTKVGAITGLDKPEAIEDEAPEAAVRPFVDFGE